MTLTRPGVEPQQIARHGGDDSVERDGHGRPRIHVPCAKCGRSGRVPSVKRPGDTIQCPACKGAKWIVRSYTRTTAYVDALDDKGNLGAYHKAMTLRGAAFDIDLLKGIAELDPEDAQDKRELYRRAEAASKAGGSERKADHGNYLHDLSELTDAGMPFPDEATFEDIADMEAYRQITRSFPPVHSERLVVHDRLKVAGTPDRVSRWAGEGDLVAPDGKVITKPLITDLKTGRLSYSRLKYSMQMALYSRSKLYDTETYARTSMGVDQDWGIIWHVPAGTGEGRALWVPLREGWEHVKLAGKVRQARKVGKILWDELQTK